MKILHISLSDNNGGAARAAYRIHKSLIDYGVNSKMLVQESILDDWSVTGNSKKIDKLLNYLRQYIAFAFVKLQKTKNPILHSPSIVPSTWLKKINSSDADIVHLHWVQGEMLSISDINKIKKPIIWSLHDMWGFCGAEHISWDNRWKEGYFKNNRPAHETGFDINRWIWKRKKRFWKKPIQIIAPSRWLANCVSDSIIMKNWPVKVVPNPLNINIWKPLDQNIARDMFGLPLDRPLLLFGTMGANTDHNKGFDLLINALNILSNNKDTPKGLSLVVFGQKAPKIEPILPFPAYYIGKLSDDISLRALYNAVDLVIVPSRLESFGQTASEAHSCGIPVVAFNTSGLRDIIEHKQTGYLANSFDSIDLANGINWVLNNPNKKMLSENARLKSITHFSSSLVAKSLVRIYENLLNRTN